MKKYIFIFVLIFLTLAVTGCTRTVNFKDTNGNMQNNDAAAIVENEEKTNFVRQMDLTEREEFLINAFAAGNRNNAVFEIITEDYTAFVLKTYKFEDGQWNYTYNFCDGKIRDENTLLAVEYYYLPNINAAFSSGSLGGYFHDDVYDVEYSYTSDTQVRSWFEVSEEETAFIAYRRLKAGGEGKLANTTDFAKPAAVTDADETDEYYMITISFIR